MFTIPPPSIDRRTAARAVDPRDLLIQHKRLISVAQVVRHSSPELADEIEAIGGDFLQTSTGLALRDPATGIQNARALEDRLPAEVSRARRTSALPLSCLMVDGNNFRDLNFRYGHVDTNKIISELCLLMEHELRPSDLLVRFGGDECAALLGGTTADEALPLAIRLCNVIANHPFLGGKARVSVTIGVATLLLSDRDGKAMLARADIALYYAKAHMKGAAHAWTSDLGWPDGYYG